MKIEVLVLGTKAYQTEFNGQKFTGLKVAYILPDSNLDPDTYGHFPAENKFDYELHRKIKEVPGVYEINMEMQVKKGKTEVVATDIDFIRPFELTW